MQFKTAVRARGLDVISVYTIANPNPDDLSYGTGDDLSLHEYDGAIESIAAAVTGRFRPRAVIACTEPAVPTADRLAALLGLAGNPVETTAARRDKWHMRLLAAERGVPTPTFHLVGSPAEIPAAVARTGYPCIIKPTTGAASHGVTLLTSPADSLDALPERDVFGGPVAQRLVEEYVHGPEYAVNTFTRDGQHTVIDVWRKHQPDDRPYDQPYWNACQVPADDAVTPSLRRFAHQVLDAFDIRHGPCHIELKTENGRPRLIEIGARLPGAHIPELWLSEGGFDAFGACVDLLLRRQVPHPVLRLAGLGGVGDDVLGQCFIGHAGPEAVLHGIDGLDEVARLPEVVAVHRNALVGRPLRTTSDLESVALTVALRASGPEHFLRLCDLVRATVVLRTEERIPAAVPGGGAR
ncbi:ATP-grasp domain-containing protein [Streptomyces sp. CA-111067]|uniref:ATP-grasp domain-containing protein n=1 Tax=Streptomyces sp. CA-111067 TaxID=3240046 RepID=UPI003D974E02